MSSLPSFLVLNSSHYFNTSVPNLFLPIERWTLWYFPILMTLSMKKSVKSWQPFMFISTNESSSLTNCMPYKSTIHEFYMLTSFRLVKTFIHCKSPKGC